MVRIRERTKLRAHLDNVDALLLITTLPLSEIKGALHTDARMENQLVTIPANRG